MPFDPLAELKKLPAGTMLLLGSEGHAVKLLKRALSVHGFGPPEWKNFNKPVAAVFDENLQTVVISFQKAKGLEVDGVAGKDTIDALSRKPAVQPVADPLIALAPLRDAAVKAAGSGIVRGVAAAHKALDLHIKETGGENRGPLVEAIQVYAAKSRFYPWCAAFCDVCMRFGFEAAGEKLPITIGVSCSDLIRRAAAVGRVFEVKDGNSKEFKVTTAQSGDLLVLRGGPTRYKHIGIVAENRPSGGPVATIEGNTNDQGSAEGDGVYKKRRDPKRTPFVIVRLS